MKKTPLHQIHIDLRARMGEFAGYDMPIQYPDGVMAEHHWTRSHAGIFDVSHMGQIMITGPGATMFLQRLTPSHFSSLKPFVAKYTVLMNEEGGIIDDMIVTKLSDTKYFIVINASCKDKDIAWMKTQLFGDVTLSVLDDRALIALQGPKAEAVLRQALDINAADLGYMRWMEFGSCFVSRLGYTGEDGFEISMPAGESAEAWRRLTAHEDVRPIGLGARDSLRLEMGYPLYGHDIDATTSPVEAAIGWIMGKAENTNFIGAARIWHEKQNGLSRIRAGIRLTGQGIAREGAEIFSLSGEKIGAVTSGGFCPTLNAAIAMGYMTPAFAAPETKIMLRVRGRDIEAITTPLPFVKAKTKVK